MAHRGPMRELFQFACVTLLFGMSEKEDIPSPRAYIKIRDPRKNGHLYPQMVPFVPRPTPPPFIFWLVNTFISMFGDELLEILCYLAPLLFCFVFPPFARGIKRCVVKIGRFASRAFNTLTSHRHVQDGTMSDATTQTQTITPQITITTPGDEAALSALRSKHTQEMSEMFLKYYRTTSMLREKDRLLENVRTAIDPEGFYANENINMAADAQAKEVRRLTTQIWWKRRQTKAAEKKAAETEKLAKKNWILKNQIESMTLHTELAKTNAWGRERQLRKEVKEITDFATTGTVSLVSYRAQFDTIHRLELALEAAQKQTRNTEEEGRVALEGVRDELTSVQSIVQHLTSTQAPDESSQAEGQRALERAIESARQAERKVEKSEKKARESAATVSGLEQSLSKARDEVRLLSDSDQVLQQRLDTALAALEKKQSPAAPDAALSAEIESLRSQLNDASGQASEQFQNGYLAAIAQNPPADQGQEASTQTDHEENNGSESREEELRSEIEQLKAAKNDVEQKFDSQKSQTEEAVLEERRQAQEWLRAAQAQVRDDLTTAYNQQWAAASASFQAEVQGVKDLGRRVEDDRNAIAQQLLAAQQELANSQASSNNPSETERVLREQLQEVSDNYESAMDRLENPEGVLKDSKDILEGVIARCEAAEEEIKKYQSGKAAQDGRIKDLNVENTALKKAARGELELAESTANLNDKVRATALTDELINRHYDHPSRAAATQLMNANAKIMELKLFLNKTRNQYSQVTCLQILQHAEVDRAYKELEGSNRTVLVKQCEGVNAKLMVLKAMINNGPRDPKKSELLQEIYNARGDELAVWNEAETPSSESSDEDDDNAGEGSSTSAPRRPVRPLPTSRRPLPTAPIGIPDTPLPSDPRPNNALKRKSDADNDNAGEESSKRNDASEMGMRPITGASQGPSSLAGADRQKATETASQNDLSSSMQGVASSSQAENPLQPKPTKIPGPTAIASLTRQYENNSGVPTTIAEGNTGFTFSVPRDIASAATTSPPPTTPQAPPNHERIFTGLSLLGAAIADKKTALPGLPAPSEDDEGAVDFLINLGSSSAARDSDSDAEEEGDRILAHLAGRNEGEEEDDIAWENDLYDDFD